MELLFGLFLIGSIIGIIGSIICAIRKNLLWKKWLISGVALFFLCFIVLAFTPSKPIEHPQPANQSAPTQTTAPSQTSNTASTKLPSYEVVKTEKLSFDRLSLNIVVKEPATVDQLKFIATTIIEDAKKKAAFRAINIFFDDYPEYIGKGTTLGKIVYGPNGSIAVDQSVKPGDYAKMSFSYELKEKDWNKRLTPEEVKIWSSWQKYYHERRQANDNRPEEALREEFSTKNNLSTEKVSTISFKQLSWSM